MANCTHLSLFTLLAFGPVIFADNLPAPLQAATQPKKLYDSAVTKLRMRYESTVADALSKFDELIAKAKKDGNLDLVQTLKSEKERASTDAPLGTLLADVVSARRVFDSIKQKASSEFETSARELHSKFVKELDDLVKSELAANRIESSKAIRKYRAIIEEIGPAPLIDPSQWRQVSRWQWRFGEEKARLLKSAGGSDQSEAAVSAGLVWLAQQQKPDGSWELPGDPRKIAATGIALLPFLVAGYSHKGTPADKVEHLDRLRSKYPSQIGKGLKYLLAKQTRAGDFDEDNLYDHAIATMALCDAYGMTTDSRLKSHAQLAVDFIVKAQHAAGGWRYSPNQAGDTSVTGWQIEALKIAQLAGLKVPKETLTKANAYLDTVAGGAPNGSTYGYVGRGASLDDRSRSIVPAIPGLGTEEPRFDRRR